MPAALCTGVVLLAWTAAATAHGPAGQARPAAPDAAGQCRPTVALRAVDRLFDAISAGSAARVDAAMTSVPVGVRFVRIKSIDRSMPVRGTIFFTTRAGIGRTVSPRPAAGEELRVYALKMGRVHWTTGGRVAGFTAFFTRTAEDVPQLAWGAGGAAKGEIACADGKVAGLNAAHVPLLEQIDVNAEGLEICRDRPQRTHLAGIGWACR